MAHAHCQMAVASDKHPELSIDELLDRFTEEMHAAYAMDVHPHTVCNSCGEDDIDSDGDNTICLHCGNIITYHIDLSCERRYFTEDMRHGDPTRCGLPTNHLMPESSLGSIILPRGRMNREMRKIKRYHHYNLIPYRERALFAVFDQLQTIATNNGIPSSIVDESKEIYAKASVRCTKRSANRRALIANCMFLAMKHHKMPMLPKELAKMFSLDEALMSEGRKNIQEVLDITPESTKFSDFMARFVAGLDTIIPSRMRDEMTSVCNNICSTADELGIAPANTAQSLAASVLYLVCRHLGLVENPAFIAERCITSTVTINKCYRSLIQHQKYLFPEGFVDSLRQRMGLPDPATRTKGKSRGPNVTPVTDAQLAASAGT